MNRARQRAAQQGLAAVSLKVRAGARELVRDLSVQFTAGEVVAILGRNGSGKTLTLHTLAGLRTAAGGEVLLDGAPLLQLKRRSVALRLGLLPQDLEDAFVTTALETVLIGRHPHLALWQWETAEDERLAREALAARFADRALLLFGDGRWSLGPVGAALTAVTLSELYLAPMVELGRDGRRVFVSA